MSPELFRMVWGLYSSDERSETYLALLLVAVGLLTYWYGNRSSGSPVNQNST